MNEADQVKIRFAFAFPDVYEIGMSHLGIQILFDKPNKNLYLEIVAQLAKDAGLQTDADTLALKAEQFAMRKSGRSARAAKQFVEQLRCTEYQEKSERSDFYADT